MKAKYAGVLKFVAMFVFHVYSFVQENFEFLVEHHKTTSLETFEEVLFIERTYYKTQLNFIL